MSALTDAIRASAQLIAAKATEIDAAAPPPPPGTGGKIVWPLPNQVIQKKGANAIFKARSSGPVDTIRIRNGDTIVAENAAGEFTLVPGWYTMATVKDGAECDVQNVGVGNVIITAGQSNGYSPVYPVGYPAPAASAAGRIIVSDNLDAAPGNQGVEAFVDSFVRAPMHSACWVHALKILNRAFPTLIINRCVGSTSCYQWRYDGDGQTPPGKILQNLMKDCLFHDPLLICWHQGESLSPPQWGTEFDYMDQMLTFFNRVVATPWLMALNSFPPSPSAYIRTAQQQIIDKYAFVYPGADTDPFRLTPSDSHFRGNADPAQDQLLMIGQAVANKMVASGF